MLALIEPSELFKAVQSERIEDVRDAAHVEYRRRLVSVDSVVGVVDGICVHPHGRVVQSGPAVVSTLTG